VINVRRPSFEAVGSPDLDPPRGIGLLVYLHGARFAHFGAGLRTAPAVLAVWKEVLIQGAA
jgi:hypothetical protein